MSRLSVLDERLKARSRVRSMARPPYLKATTLPTTRMPARNPISTGQPRMTVSRPITIEDSTMTMPTERSMPAVRMIKVCAMPRMPMMVTWSRMVDRFEPVVKRAQLTEAPSSTPRSNTTNGTIVG